MQINKEVQKRVLMYVRNNIDMFKSQSSVYREQMLNIYEALSTFEMPDTGDILTRFKVNKAHEVLRKVVPKIIAKSPRFIVSPRTDIFQKGDEKKVNEDRSKMLLTHQKFAKATQDYLNILFEDENFRERLKLWAINMLTYGNSFAQIIPKFKIQRARDKNHKVTEKVVGLIPTIDVVSWTEMYYDARYKMLEDMPGITRIRKRVRLQDVMFTKGFFNIKEVETLGGTEFIDDDSYSGAILSTTGISDIRIKQGIDINNIDLQESEVKFSISGNPKDERLYKITTVNSAVVIGFEEITSFSFVDIKGHEDPEIFFSTGMIAPILGLQDELNFQKNAFATSMAKNLNKSYKWSPESGVDPGNLLNDVPGNIIVCNNGVDQANRNLEEIQDRPLESQYFNNINDMNRDFQALTHTTDVSQQGGQTALTNTATGARISFFESNSVIADIRKNFERGMQELSFKILDWTVENVDKDLILKKVNDNEFLKVNIEAIRNAIERYDIRVEANSSSFDDVENRRADAIAIKNLLIEAKNSGANIDINEGFKKVFSTFEALDMDKLMPETQNQGGGINDILGQNSGGNIPAGKQLPQQGPTTPAQLTNAVAGGKVLFQ